MFCSVQKNSSGKKSFCNATADVDANAHAYAEMLMPKFPYSPSFFLFLGSTVWIHFIQQIETQGQAW